MPQHLGQITPSREHPLALTDLPDRLRDLYSGWNQRIEQETATKLADIKQRSSVQSSLEVIGLALLTPRSAAS